MYKSNINISSINLKYIEKIDDLDYFEKFKINLNLIKRFSVQIHNKDLNCFKKLFSLFTIKNNLIHFELTSYKIEIESDFLKE